MAVVVALCLLWPSLTGADDSADLAREIASLTGTGDLATQVGARMLEPMRPKHALLASKLADSQRDLTREQKRVLFEALSDFDAFSVRYFAIVARKVDFDSLIETVLVPLYTRYFSESELRDMRDFYASPTGRKMIRVTPELMGEWMGTLSAALGRVDVEESFLEVVQEYRAELDL